MTKELNTSKSDALAPLATRLAGIQAEREQLTEIEAAIKASVKALTEGPGSYQAGDLTVVISQAGRLDLKAIEDKYPLEERPELYDAPHISTAKAREHFSPVDLEAFTKYAAPSVSVK